MKSNRTWRRLIIYFLFSALLLPGLACGLLAGDEDAVQEQINDAAAAVQEAIEEQVEETAEDIEPAPTDDEVAVPEDDSNRAPISGALRPGLEVDAIRVTISSEDLASGEITTSLAEFVQPDNYHLFDDTMDALIVDGKSYIKNEEGGWEEAFDLSLAVGVVVNSVIDPALIEAGLIMGTFSGPTGEKAFLGEESIGANTTRVYEYKIVLPGLGEEDAVTYRAWIGSDDELIYRQLIEHPIKGTRSTIEYVYEGVEIVAPAP